MSGAERIVTPQHMDKPVVTELETYEYTLLKHQTYRHEISLMSRIKAVLDIVTMIGLVVVSTIFIRSGGQASSLFFACSIALSFLAAYRTALEYAKVMDTLYGYHIKGKDDEGESDSSASIFILMSIGTMLIGFMLMTFNV